MIKILKWVTEEGVTIKNIVFMTPTVTLCSDDCRYGIEGYNDKGMEWNWHILPKWYGLLTLNLIEFLAS